jgi:hypothetical protein
LKLGFPPRIPSPTGVPPVIPRKEPLGFVPRDPPQNGLSQGSPLGIPPVTPRENQPQEFPLILPTPTWDRRNIAHVQSYLVGGGSLVSTIATTTTTSPPRYPKERARAHHYLSWLCCGSPGFSWVLLGLSWALLGLSWGSPGLLMKLSWNLLKLCWALLGLSWGFPGPPRPPQGV